MCALGIIRTIFALRNLGCAGESDVNEVLFISGSQLDVIAFLTAAGALRGYEQKTVFLTDSAATQSVLEEVPGNLVSSIRGTRPAQLSENDTVYGTFAASYLTAYDEDVTAFSFAAHAYDAAWVTMLGMAWAHFNEAAISGRNIARGVRRLSKGEELSFTPSKWPAILQRFRSSESVNILGTSGHLDFDPSTEEVSAPVDVWRVDATENGALRLVIDYSVAEPAP